MGLDKANLANDPGNDAQVLERCGAILRVGHGLSIGGEFREKSFRKRGKSETRTISLAGWRKRSVGVFLASSRGLPTGRQCGAVS